MGCFAAYGLAGPRQAGPSSTQRPIAIGCAAIDGTWNDTDLGDLRDVDPPVRFGFSSTPRQPSIVEVTTTVYRTQG